MKTSELVSLALVSSLCGCYSHSEVLRPKRVNAIDAAFRVQAGLEVGATSKAPPAADQSCEVWMRLSYSRAGHGPARKHYEIMSPDTCIKRKDSPIAFPGTISLVYDPRNLLFWNAGRGFGYCDDEGRDVELAAKPKAPGADDEDVHVQVTASEANELAKAGATEYGSDLEVCSWNFKFRDSYPLDFAFWTENGPLADKAQLIQVFRNGELAFKWQNTESTADRLDIPGNRLTTNGLRHLSDFDLRIFPAGALVDETVLEQEVRAHDDPALRRFKRAAKAIYETKLFEGGTQSLEDQVLPVLQAIDRVNASVAALTGEPVGDPLAPAAAVGTAPPLTSGKTLLERYRALKGLTAEQAKKQADAIAADVSRELGIERKQLASALDGVEKKLREEFSKCGAAGAAPSPLCTAYKTLAELERDLDAVDDLVEATLQTADETVLLATRLRDDALAVGNSTELQAKLYNQVVASLAEEGDFFDPYVANPAAVGSEAILPMHYSDTFQLYVLAPWNGVALRPEDAFATEPSATYAIPILDGVGLRYQWIRDRLNEVRLGLGAMYFEDADVVPESGEDSDESEHKEARFALQANVSIYGARIGLAYVPDATSKGDKNGKLRLLLGVDLIKLLTGRNLEVAQANF